MKSKPALDWIPILSSVTTPIQTSAKIFLARGTLAALCLLALAHPLWASTQVWQWTIPQRYEAARPFDPTGLAAVRLDRKCGLIDQSGNQILSCAYNEITALRPQGLPTGTENIPSDNEAYEQEVLTLVNAERQKRNLAPLAWNENLARAARYHAADMAANDYFDHDSMARPAGSPNARPRRIGSWQQRVTAFDPTASGENIALGQPTPAAVMKSWINSSGHRANILRPTNVTLGIGYIANHWVQDFGR